MTRGRPPLIRPVRPLNVHVDQELITRADLLLYSELESRVPKGAYQKLFNQLLRQWLDSSTLDLAPYSGGMPGQQIVSGTAGTVESLKLLLDPAWPRT
jgi:hypothetical protein